jgi:glycosyltransferase involved in cell wall biosynthesis
LQYKILFNTEIFITWQGGIDLLKYILTPLLKMNKKNFKIYVIVHKKKTFLSHFKYFFNLIKQLKNINEYLIGKKFISPIEEGNNQILEFLISANEKPIIIYSNYSNFEKEYTKIKPDLVFPCLKPHPISKNKNFGYVFDTQHNTFKKNFSKDEVLLRKKNDKILFKASKAILVNSLFMKKSLKKEINIHKKKIYSIPFLPFNTATIIDDNKNIKKKFNINKNYFIVCSQFWKHKNHIFILNVFFKYCSQGGKCDLVLTGHISDYRFPEYFLEIKKIINNSIFKNRIKILGNINKEYQISLLRNSKLLIHASLYEGGPGAGACHEAIALGVPIAVSRIPIHNEIKYKKKNIFNPFKYDELLKIMIKYSNKNFKVLTKNKIIKNTKKNVKILSNFYSNTFKEVLKIK